MNSPKEEVEEMLLHHSGDWNEAGKEADEILEIIENLDGYQDQRPFWVEVKNILTKTPK